MTESLYDILDKGGIDRRRLPKPSLVAVTFYWPYIEEEDLPRIVLIGKEAEHRSREWILGKAAEIALQRP
jgi:hypothetical protein